MPSRTRKREVQEEPTVELSSSAPRRTKRARHDSVKAEAEGGSSATLLGDTPPQPSSKKRDKGKARAISPVEEVGADDARIIIGQRALLGRLAHSFSCGICISLFDNPVSLICGHIFCRGCLERCFRRELSEHTDDGVTLVLGPDDHEIRPVAGPSSPRGPVNLSPADKRRNLVCPVCRARVQDAPMPLFVFREAADAMRRADADGVLPPETERRADSPALANKGYDVARRARQDADTSWGGLFESGGKEKKKRRQVFDRGINDREDGVFRCWNCNWEIEDGQCNACGRIYDEYELTRDTDEESHFSNLPNGVEDSSDESSTAGRRHPMVSVRVDTDIPGTDDLDEDAEDSDDREFIVGSDEEVVEAGSASDGFLDDEPSRPRVRRVVIVSSDDEDGPARAPEDASVDDSETESESGSVQVAGELGPVVLSSDEDDASPADAGDPATLFSPPAIVDESQESEEETSQDQRRRLREEKRARKSARRERRRQRAEAVATEEADSEIEEAEAPAEPTRRRRQISDPSPPRRNRLRIQESDDD